jgi:hypothetical protein
VILTAGAAAGGEKEAFVVLTLWTLATLFFHALRFAWIAATARFETSSGSRSGREK